MKKVKIAVIGINHYSHAKHIFSSIAKQKDIFDLVGYALVEDEREKFGEDLNKYAGYPEMTLDEILNDPTIEAVAVETEEVHLTKYALMAARHGKHIHMEKPGGFDLSEFEELIATVKKNGTVFHTGYMYRYNPYVLKIMEEVKNGDFGEIYGVEAQMNCYHKPSMRKWLESFPGGMMMFLGCHLIDLIVGIMGQPQKITSYCRTTEADGLTPDDFGMAVLEYPHGVSFAKTTAIEVGGFDRRQLVINGSKKTVELKPFEVVENGSVIYTKKTEYTNAEVFTAGGEETRTELFDRYDAMMSSFAAMARGEKENPYTYDYELEVYKSVLKACGQYKK